jgi:hypothetical protein
MTIFTLPLTPTQRQALHTLRTLFGTDTVERLLVRGYTEIESHISPGRLYRISTHGEVEVRRDGARIASLCVSTQEPLPWPDSILAHMLHIEGDEEGYLKEANILVTYRFSIRDNDLLTARWR